MNEEQLKLARVEMLARQARTNMLSFMQWVWWMPKTTPFIVGRHTKAICDRLTKAVEDFRQGKSTYLLIDVPFRHGKSDIVSRALPAFFLGRNADMMPSIIMSGYGDDLVSGFSKDTSSCSPTFAPTRRTIPSTLGASRVPSESSLSLVSRAASRARAATSSSSTTTARRGRRPNPSPSATKCGTSLPTPCSPAKTRQPQSSWCAPRRGTLTTFAAESSRR